MQWAYKIPVTAPCLKSFKGKIRVKSVWRSCNLNLASGYLRLDPCSECKINPLSPTLVCVRSDMAEQRLCQGHVAGGSEPSPTSWGVCGSGHTGQRTPAVAPTGRYIRLCVSVCVQWGLSVRDSCCVPEWRWGREKKQQSVYVWQFPHPCFPSAVCPSPGVPKPLSECIVDVESMDIFPVGWCEANAYPLTPPIKPVCTYTHKYTQM